MAKIGFCRLFHLDQYLSDLHASISKNIKIIFKHSYILHNQSHVIAQCKNENGLCARSQKKVKAQKLVKLLCQSTFSQLAKCFHDFLTDHNLLFVMGFFVVKKLEKFKSKCKTCFSSNHCMSINIYTAYELHVFHEEKRIPTFHELFNQFFSARSQKSQRKKNVLYQIVNQHLHSPFVYTNNEVV